jgi:hypothetical protein
MDDAGSNRKLVESFVRAVFIDHDLSSLDRHMKDGYIQHNPVALSLTWVRTTTTRAVTKRECSAISRGRREISGTN